MKLNRHQKEIISKILSKDIYDITSYLNCFNLCHIEKYDMEKLEKEFLKFENGKQYKVMKDGRYEHSHHYKKACRVYPASFLFIFIRSIE